MIGTTLFFALAITDATVHTAPGKVIEHATVVIDGGKITAVGAGAKAPAGAKVIDGKGLVVTAGLIDAATTLGMVEVELVESTNDAQDGPTEVHAATRVTDAWNPESIAIPVARAAGVTTVVAIPRGGLVHGSGAALSLGAGLSTAKAVRKVVTGVYVRLGEGAVRHGHGSRAAAVERLREVLADAADYAKRRGAFEKRQTRDYAASRLDLEALGPVIRGEVPLVVRVDRAADIRAALAVGAELRLKLVILGGTEAWMLAAELAAAKVPVVMDPMSNLPDSFDTVHVRDDAAAILRKAGVDVAITPLSTQSGGHRLRQAAGIAVAYGLTWADALASVTTVPAKIFGLKRGELTVGAPADVVVWDGDPLETSTLARAVIIDGVEQPMTSRQTKLLQRYRKVP